MDLMLLWIKNRFCSSCPVPSECVLLMPLSLGSSSSSIVRKHEDFDQQSKLNAVSILVQERTFLSKGGGGRGGWGQFMTEQIPFLLIYSQFQNCP